MAVARLHAVASVAKMLLAFTLATSGSAHSEDYWAEWHRQLDWPMYGRDLHYTFSNPHSLIRPGNVTSMKPVWDFATGDAVSASPAVVNGIVYIGAWDGYFYALKATNGSLVWKFQVDCQNTVVPIPPQCLAPGETQPPRFFTSGGLIGSEGPSLRKRTVKNENTGEILPVSGEKGRCHSDDGLNCLFAACNHCVQWITFFTPSLARRLPCEAQALLGWRKEAR